MWCTALSAILYKSHLYPSSSHRNTITLRKNSGNPKSLRLNFYPVAKYYESTAASSMKMAVFPEVLLPRWQFAFYFLPSLFPLPLELRKLATFLHVCLHNNHDNNNAYFLRWVGKENLAPPVNKWAEDSDISCHFLLSTTATQSNYSQPPFPLLRGNSATLQNAQWGKVPFFGILSQRKEESACVQVCTIISLEGNKWARIFTKRKRSRRGIFCNNDFLVGLSLLSHPTLINIHVQLCKFLRKKMFQSCSYNGIILWCLYFVYQCAWHKHEFFEHMFR